MSQRTEASSGIPPPGAPRPADNEAREAARTVFDRPFILEAGAGTGKTAVLVARILTWCLDSGWNRAASGMDPRTADAAEEIASRVLSRIVAITFTEKAAAEMETRIAAALRALTAGGSTGDFDPGMLDLPAAERARRARTLLGSFDRFEVATIHAFCRRLIAGNPVEAGVAPGFEVDADERRLAAAVDDSLAALVARSFGSPEPESDAHALALAGYGPAAIGEALRDLVAAGIPPSALDGDPCKPALAVAAAGHLHDAVLALLDLVEAPLLRGGGRVGSARETVATLRALANRLPAIRTIEDLAAVVSEQASLDVAGSKKLDDWASNKTSASEAACLGTAAGSVGGLARPVRDRLRHLQAIDPELLRPAFRILSRCLRGIQDRLQREGTLTFHDLLAKARDLLAGHDTVCARIRRSFDQILVDEFQDTDPIQYDIVERLALAAPPSDRPGLFLVGDPKQSIYGWRHADLAAFERFLGRVVAGGGERRTLYVNFRSVPAILDEVTRIVEPVMLPVPGIQPPFERLLPGKTGSGKNGTPVAAGRAAVEHWVSWLRKPLHDGDKIGPETLADRARELEAAAVAADLIELRRSDGFRFGDVAVLARTIANLETVLDALREAGIPYLVEKGCTFFRRREIFDAVSLLRVALDPLDHLALAGFFRSPVAGVPDAALPLLWSRGVPDLFTALTGPDPELLRRIDSAVDAAAVPPGVPGIGRIEGWKDLVKHAARSLARIRQDFHTTDADVFLTRMRGVFLGEVTESARHRGAWRLSNLERLFRRLFTALTSGDGGPDALLRELRTALDEARKEEEGRPGDTALDAVRVMTIHKAKGLTFQQVYVVGLHGESGRGRPELKAEMGRTPDGNPEFRLFGVPTPGFDAVARRRREVADAEMVRLLYVASTRPARRLVLAGRWSDTAGALPRASVAASMADLLRHRAGRIPDLGAIAAGTPSSRVDDDGVLWRVLGTMADLESAESESECSAAEMEGHEDLAARRALRVRAAARSRRRLTAAVTADARETLEAAYEDAPGDEAPLEGGGIERRPQPEPSSGFPDPREAAMAAGSAIHRVLEHLDLEAPEEAAIQAQRSRLPHYLREHLPEDGAARLLPAAEELLSRIVENGMVGRLRGLSGTIVGREVPLLINASAERDPGPGPESAGPVGARVGAIDLLYRDPGSGEWVIADFKTDQISDRAVASDRTLEYVHQGRTYADALRSAFDLPARPRFELWFLRAGIVLPVDLD